MISRRMSFLTALALAVLAGPPSVLAQSWPTKPVTLVVSYPAGGDTDAVARLYAEKLSTRLGQPVIVDNRPGASGMIGDKAVANAANDGYTLLFTPSQFASAHHVVKSTTVARDPVADFTPIIEAGYISLVLVTSPSSGIKDVKQIVTDAKNGRALTYGSPGTGSPMQFVGEMLNKAAGTKLSHVAYRGVAPSVVDALGGHIPLVWATPGTVIQHIQSGRLVALAVSDPVRSKLFPNVPTLLEAGYPVVLKAWLGLLGPKGLSPEIVRVVNTHMNEIIGMPDVQSKMASLGVLPEGGTPAKFAQAIAEDDQKFSVMAKEFAIRAD